MLVNSNLYGISHVEQAFSAFLVMNSHGLTPKEYKNFLYGKLLDQEQRSLGQKAFYYFSHWQKLLMKVMNNLLSG